jgi:hypothetical protein
MSSGNAGKFPGASRSTCHLRELRELLREMAPGKFAFSGRKKSSINPTLSVNLLLNGFITVTIRGVFLS